MSANNAVEYLEQFLGNDDGELSWQVCEAIGEVLERLRAAEVDAGRYRFIREHGVPDAAIADMDSYYGYLMCAKNESMDKAIDQAMKEQAK